MSRARSSFVAHICGLLMLAWCAPVTSSDLTLQAKTLFARGITKGLALSKDGTALVLTEGELIESDGPAAGYSYKPNLEKLSDSVWIKKELNVSDPRASKATLLVGPGGDLNAIINGKPQRLVSAGKVGGYWTSYEIPPTSLKSGNNTFVLYGSGRVWIARDDERASGTAGKPESPNQSSRSTDKGKTWVRNKLGPSGDIAGEYYVRLFLHHYRTKGSLTLPVLDAGNLTDEKLAAPVASLGPVEVRATGANGIRLFMRTGPTPEPGDKAWSMWQSTTESVLIDKKPRGRYVQIKVEIATSDPRSSPQFKSLTIRANPKRSEDWTRKVEVTDYHNEEIVRSSIPFRYEPFDHPRLKLFRERYKLDDIVRGAKSELEIITRLAKWSSQRWKKGHLRDIYPPWDALEILKLHQDQTPVGGFCQQYNLVFLQACESFGIPGRAVSLGPGDHGAKIRGGHEVVELWSNQFRKWIYVDGNAAWYLKDKATGVPLSLLELRDRQIDTVKGKSTPAVELVRLAQTRYEWKGLQAWPPFFELRMIPRSNFLEKDAPVPLNQGMRGWFWTGHYVWTDSSYPASLLYGHRVRRRGNWEWTLNQAHIHLEPMSTPGTMRAHFTTHSPGLQSFQVQIDDHKRQSVSSPLIWKLHKGLNRLVVTPVNVAGRKGIPGSITLRY